MDNSVYLLSHNLNLIKYFLNYDRLGDIFKLEGLSTNIQIFDCKSINNNDIVIVIDNYKEQIEHVNLIKQIQKLQESKRITLVYASEFISSQMMSEIEKIESYKIITKALDFLTFLNWIQYHDKVSIDKINIEKEVMKHLQYMRISAGVLGFTYLKEAVLLKSNESKMKLVDICDKIAREHHTTSSRVERCMRTALNKTGKEQLAFIGIQVSRLSCKDFIAQFANHILNDHKE